MSVVVSHPTGNANVRAVIRALDRAALLDSFWTSFAIPAPISHLFPQRSSLRRELGRRTFTETSWKNTRVCPRFEALRITTKRLSHPAFARIRAAAGSVDTVYDHLDRAVAAYLRKSAPVAVEVAYAFEDGALETFRAAAETGRRRVYDLPIAYWRSLQQILTEERAINPQWAGTLGALQDSPKKLERKELEIASADVVLVASTFTRNSVEAHFGSSRTIVVTPYGAPEPYVSGPAVREKDAPLIIVYAGQLDQRKGLSYFIAALEMLTIPWRAVLAGSMPVSAPSALLKFLDRRNVTYLGHVPHLTLLEYMTIGHVFVFPSLVEGFGMVLTEALASGLPIITTEHTAGPDLIQEGVQGHIVPIRDPYAIAARLTALFEDETARQEMGLAAIFAATQRPWRAYESQIARLILQQGHAS